MNREIKFRAWSNTSGQLEYFSLSDVMASGESCSDYDSSSVMQFTGLQDINGIDIYDGDVVKSSSASDYHSAMITFTNSEWSIGGFHKLTESSIGFFKVVVIGNIYQIQRC